MYESVGKVRATQAFQIHREKCDIGELVAIAQARVELEAVDDAWPVGKAEDRIRSQVAMTVDDVTLGDPPLEQLGAASEIAVDEPALSLAERLAKHALNQGPQFGKVCLPTGAEPCSSRHAINPGATGSPGVKGGKDVCCSVQFTTHVRVGGDESRELPVTRQASHDDDRIDQPSVLVADFIDPAIYIGRESPVQRDLLAASGTP